MPQPDEFGLSEIPGGIWNDDFRGMGGVNIDDALATRDAEQARQQAAAQAEYAAQQNAERANADAGLQAQYDEAQKNFVDWPTFQKLAAEKQPDPQRQYDGYLEALSWQLQQMGYTEEEADAEVKQFQRMVPRPAEDRGVVGNLLESASGGLSSGLRAVRAATAAAFGDDPTLAALGAEGAGVGRNAALTRFNQALGDKSGVDPADANISGGESPTQVFKRFGRAAMAEPQGLLNFFVDQISQSAPVLAASLGGAAAGSPGGPLGVAGGLAVGTGAGSFALDAGSTILDTLTDIAHTQGVDPTDKAAMLALLKDPYTRQQVIQAGVDHGWPVAVMDGLTSVLSGGLGVLGGRALKAGRGLRAAGYGAAGLGAEALGGATGEALGQVNQFGEVKNPMDVLMEAVGELGPGIAHTAGGAVYDRFRKQPAAVVPPGAPPAPNLGGDFDESDLPGGNDVTSPAGPDPFDRVPPSQHPLALIQEAEASLAGIQVEELPFEEHELQALPTENIDITAPQDRTLPVPVGPVTVTPQNPTLAVTPEGVAAPAAQLEDAAQQERIAALAPQVGSVDVNDVFSLLDRMLFRGIAVEPGSDLHDALEFIAAAPKNDKQTAIAAMIEGLANSKNPDADAASLELIRIARTLRPQRETTRSDAIASVAQIATELGITPEQVIPAVSQALAQEIVDAVVTSQPAAALPVETPVQAKRGLRRGESVPPTSLAALAGQLTGGGPVQNAPGADQAQEQPRRGLRSRVPAQGTGAGGPVNRGQRSIAPIGQGSNRVESNDLEGDSGVPRIVRGFQYGVEGTTDVANTEALQRAKDEALAQRQTGGLSKRGLKKLATERKRAIDLAVLTKDEYEKTYPGRNYDDDLQKIVSADRSDDGSESVQISDSQLLAFQAMTADQVLNYIASVAPNPLQRAVARELTSLHLPTVFRLRRLDRRSAGRYIYGEDATGKPELDHVVIDPYSNTGRDIASILHEYVHAATLLSYVSPQTPQQRKAVIQIDALYRLVKAALPTNTQYGLTDAKEFIAEGLSNPEFQNVLSTIQLPESKISAWTAFKALVMKILGLAEPNSALAKLLATAEDLFSADRGNVLMNKEGKISADIKAQGAVAPSTAIIGIRDGARAQIAYQKVKGDPNSTYTLYTVQPGGDQRGDPATKIKNLTRADVEGYIRGAGNKVLPPVADTQPAPGTPKTSSTKLVGFAPNGDLRIVAFEQKDGTWTYYESDDDVRTDPDAKVYKGLTKAQAERYIAAKGVQPTQPKLNAVKPDGTKPSAIGYKTPNKWGVDFANSEEALIALRKGQEAAGVPVNERVDYAAIRRNSIVQQKLNQVHKQYVEQIAKAGEQVSKHFNKTEPEIWDVLINLHLVERSQNKIRQIQRGNLDPATQAKMINQQQANITKGQNYIKNLANPQYVAMVQKELAPKVKALTDNTIDMYAQYGFIDRQAAENIKRAYDVYVPLQSGDRTSVGKAATGQATGGNLTFARLQEQAYRTIARGEQNKIRAMVMDLANKYGITNTDTKENVASVGASTKVRYDPETNSLNEGVDNHVFDENTITVYRNGERIPLTIHDDAMLQALHPYKGEERKTAATTLLGIVGAVTKTIAIGKTALSPVFPLRNFVRDVGTAQINMPKGVSRLEFTKELHNPETYIAAFTNSFRDAVGKEMTGRFAQANKAGSFVSRRAYVGLDELVNSVNAEFRPSIKNRFKKLAGVDSSGGSVFKLATAYSQAIESATRYAVYKAAKNSGLSEIEAGVAAKTASVNFENRGVKNISPLYMFANAKVQGLRALNDTRKENSKAAVLSFTASMIALGLVASALGYKYSDKDKDGKSKYEKIPDYKKDNLVLFKEGALGVPIPQEVALFYVLGNALGDSWYGDRTNGATGSRIFTAMVNTLWPGNVPQSDVIGHKSRPVEFMGRAIVPTATMPIVDFMTNRNTWGSPIVSNLDRKKEQGIPGYDMGSANESQLAVNVAKSLYKTTGGVVDVAPQQLTYLNRYLNPTAEATLFFRDLFSDREPKYEGEVVNPVARAFTGKATGFYDQDQFAELLSKATQAAYLAKKDGIESLSMEDQALAKSAGMLNRVQKDAEDLFKNYKLLSQDQIKLRQARQSELILDGIRRYNELRDRMPRN